MVCEAILRMMHERLAAEPWNRDLAVRMHPIAYKQLLEEVDDELVSELAAPDGARIAGMPITQDADLNPEQIIVEPRRA